MIFHAQGDTMYHYNPKIALEELQEDALLPHPVKLRDMILRNQLGPQEAQLLNHDFQDYLTRFGELQKIARDILDKLAAGQRKTA
jgi:isochorismate hydrolase